MRRSLRLLPLTVLLACATRGEFQSDRYASSRHPYGVYFAGGDADELVSRHWRLDNYQGQRRGSSRQDNGSSDGTYTIAATGREPEFTPKRGGVYEVVRQYDLNGDGAADVKKTEPFYELLLEHEHRDAQLWVRAVPLTAAEDRAELSALAQQYVQAAVAARDVTPKFGAEAVALGVEPAAEPGLASRVLALGTCNVAGKQAVLVEFELASVERALAGGERRQRGRVAMIRPEFDQQLNHQGREVAVPVLVLVGLAAHPYDFSSLQGDFVALLSNVVFGRKHEPLPSRAGHTCSVQRSSGGETLPPGAGRPATGPAAPAGPVPPPTSAKPTTPVPATTPPTSSAPAAPGSAAPASGAPAAAPAAPTAPAAVPDAAPAAPAVPSAPATPTAPGPPHGR